MFHAFPHPFPRNAVICHQQKGRMLLLILQWRKLIYIYNAEVLMVATNNSCLRWKWKQLQLQQHSNPLQSHEAAGPIISNLGPSLLCQNLLQHLVNKTLLIHRHIEAMYVINGYHSGQVSLLLKREINLAPPSKSKGAAVDFTMRGVLTDAHM